MENAPPARRRRSDQEKLADAIAAGERAAVRYERKRRQIEKYQAVQKGQERKRDTRRKIIAGALALEHKEPVFRGKLMALIDEYVTSDRERALFDLAPLPVPVPVRPQVMIDQPVVSTAPIAAAAVRAPTAAAAPLTTVAPPVKPAPIMTVTAPVVAPPPKPVPPAPTSATAPKESNLAAAVKAVAGIALAFGATAIKPDAARPRKEG